MGGTVASFSHTTRAELFRTLKQPLTWTLFLALLVLMALNYRGKVEHALELPPEVENSFLPTPEESRQAAILPNTFMQLQTGFHFPAVFSLLLATISASQGFSWGTVRTVLSREPRRGRLLAARFAALAAVVAITLLLIWLAYAPLGAWGSQRLEARIDLSFLNGLFLLKQLAMLARIWLAILPVITLGLFVGVWARRTAIAITLGGMTYFLTWFSLMFFLGLMIPVIVAPTVEAGQSLSSIDLGIWGDLPTLSPIYNMNVLVHWGDLEMMRTDDSLAVLASLNMNMGLSHNPWRGLGILFNYGALSLALARWIFWRQDVTP